MENGPYIELWRALISCAVLVVIAFGGYIVSIIRKLKSDWDAARRENEKRDNVREEIRENVERLANGHGIKHDKRRDDPERKTRATDRPQPLQDSPVKHPSQ